MTGASRRSRLTAAILLAVATLILCGPVTAAGHPAAGVGAVSSPPLPPSSPAPRWGWPVFPPHQLLRPFEAPPTPYAAGHRGVDLTAEAGAAVMAPADGVVSFAGTVVDRPVLSVRHADGLVSSIEPVRSTLPAGTDVRAGDTVGVVTSGGHCDDRCVHFGVRLHGEYVNPMALVDALERAVLLPLGR